MSVLTEERFIELILPLQSRVAKVQEENESLKQLVASLQAMVNNMVGAAAKQTNTRTSIQTGLSYNNKPTSLIDTAKQTSGRTQLSPKAVPTPAAKATTIKKQQTPSVLNPKRPTTAASPKRQVKPLLQTALSPSKKPDQGTIGTRLATDLDQTKLTSKTILQRPLDQAAKKITTTPIIASQPVLKKPIVQAKKVVGGGVLDKSKRKQPSNLKLTVVEPGLVTFKLQGTSDPEDGQKIVQVQKLQLSDVQEDTNSGPDHSGEVKSDTVTASF